MLSGGQLVRIASAAWAPALCEVNPRSERLDGEFLDDRVGQQLGRQLGHLLDRGGPGQLDLEPLALPDASDLVEAKPPAGASDRVALRIMDLGLEHDVDDDFRHTGRLTRAAFERVGEVPAASGLRASRERPEGARGFRASRRGAGGVWTEERFWRRGKTLPKGASTTERETPSEPE